MSDALVWQIIRENHAFIVKANGRTKRTGAVQFSKEAGNLYNLNTFKYSGIANSKTVDISLKNKEVTLTTGKAKKSRRPVKSLTKTPLKKGFRAVEHTLVANIANNHYRPDLKKAALARWTNLSQVAKIEKGVVKKAKIRRGRNMKN